ncbi:MAG TPA: hypothetical protein VGO55_04995 [Allosphingosinicella sp.]|jgi:hypothetical protein|nr:hypothetical protein [Allosphingosinicella sp.]
MKAIATMAAAAALLGLGGCGQLPPSGGSASSDKAGGAPAAKARAEGRTATQAGATNAANGGLASTQQGLAGNPNVIPTSSNLVLPAVDRAFLIGRWTDARDCNQAGEFAADGRYTNAAGIGAAWTLDGDRLTMTFPGAAPRTLRVSALDQNTLNVINPDESIGRSTRC